MLYNESCDKQPYPSFPNIYTYHILDNDPSRESRTVKQPLHREIMRNGHKQGKGIVHAEMPASAERAHGLQLWVNLKAKDKMISPAYQELESEDIPHVTKDGVTAIVIAGEALGVSSPVQTRTPTHYM